MKMLLKKRFLRTHPSAQFSFQVAQEGELLLGIQAGKVGEGNWKKYLHAHAKNDVIIPTYLNVFPLSKKGCKKANICTL